MSNEQKDLCPAIERAMVMMRVPLAELPHPALFFLAQAIEEVGLCGETIMTALTVFTQIEEGLECDDEIYKVDDEMRVEYAKAQELWEIVNDEVVKKDRPSAQNIDNQNTG